MLFRDSKNIHNKINRSTYRWYHKELPRALKKIEKSFGSVFIYTALLCNWHTYFYSWVSLEYRNCCSLEERDGVVLPGPLSVCSSLARSEGLVMSSGLKLQMSCWYWSTSMESLTSASACSIFPCMIVISLMSLFLRKSSSYSFICSI